MRRTQRRFAQLMCRSTWYSDWGSISALWSGNGYERSDPYCAEKAQSPSGRPGVAVYLRPTCARLPKPVHCHLKEKRGEGRVWDFPAIGEGHIDFQAVLDSTEKGGFKGPLGVEIEFHGDSWPPLAEVSRAMRASHEKLASLGRS